MSLSIIQHQVRQFIPVLNRYRFSLGEKGDKSLRVDEAEFLLTRYNGASNKEQNY